MFVDKAQVTVIGGQGGNGVVSFHHEKFIDKGGPDGGDGGDGGSVIFTASRNENTLANFRYQKTIAAPSGQAGAKSRKHGKSGADMEVKVPEGTAIIDADGELLADLTTDGQQAVIAQGGKGGFGNAHFVSSTRQTPRVAEKGEPGEQKQVTLELKMIADVGLVGLPNAGKSTLLASVSNARPEIANYPFTTLRPNLGVVDIDRHNSLLLADIPGLIEGASEGKGLGDDFLRHVERTNVLVHMIDVYQDDIAASYKTIQQELKSYKIDLSKKPQVVVLNKVDGLDQDIVNDQLKSLKKVLPRGTKVMTISAKSRQGVDKLLYALVDLVKAAKTKVAKKTATDQLPVLRLPRTDSAWSVAKTDKGFRVTGQKIERFAERTDFTNYHAVERLRDILRKTGVLHELERKGIEPGQHIVFGSTGLDLEY